LEPRLTTPSLQGVQEGRLLAADVGPGPRVHVDLDLVVLPEGVLPEVALRARLLDGRPEARLGEVELVAHVDVRGVGADPVAPDDAALDERVGVALLDRAVLEGPRLALVGVDRKSTRLNSSHVKI